MGTGPTAPTNLCSPANLLSWSAALIVADGLVDRPLTSRITTVGTSNPRNPVPTRSLGLSRVFCNNRNASARSDAPECGFWSTNSSRSKVALPAAPTDSRKENRTSASAANAMAAKREPAGNWSDIWMANSSARRHIVTWTEALPSRIKTTSLCRNAQVEHGWQSVSEAAVHPAP